MVGNFSGEGVSIPEPAKIFNAVGLVSEEMQRRLFGLAASGNDVVLGGTFAPNFPAVRERREREVRERAIAQMARLASEQQIQDLQERLDALDAATTAALLDLDEQLRFAEREVQDIRERAYEVTLADGTKARVYRDGDVVRFEDGSIADNSVVAADEIPPDKPVWPDYLGATVKVGALQDRKAAVLGYQGLLDNAREQLDSGKITPEAYAKLKGEIEANMPVEVRAQAEGRPVSAYASAVQPDPAAMPESTPIRIVLDEGTSAPETLTRGASIPAPM